MSAKGNKSVDAIKNFLLEEVLKSDTTISSAELKLLRAEIRSKLAQLTVEVTKAGPKTSAETLSSIMLTALTLKCILSLANKIERENEVL